MNQVTVQRICKDLRDTLSLEFLTEIPPEDIAVPAKDVHRPGMALMGFAEDFLPGRLQVMGASEMAYLARLNPAEQQVAFDRVLKLDTPACFIARGLQVSETILAHAGARGFPLLRSPLPAVDVISELTHYMEHELAPRTEVHGTLVDVYGVGMLFTGRSGIGKSECALDLVERGHRLVADDIVEVIKTSEDLIIGRHRRILQHNIEIRGVGVVDVQAIFGVRAIRMQKRVELEVQLEHWDDSKDYERLGLERQYSSILGVSIPRVIVPLVPGKNVTVVSEVIALDFMLKFYGYDAAQVLNQRIMEAMRSNHRVQRYFHQDRE
jgi:HPr kinase/phosphorylase